MTAKIHAIDGGGTRYDITGNLRALTRRMESGEIKARDVVVLTREFFQNNSSPRVILHHFGAGSTEDIHWMLSTAKTRIEPF